MVRLKMSETLKEATTFIEQGHIRVGPNVITGKILYYITMLSYIHIHIFVILFDSIIM